MKKNTKVKKMLRNELDISPKDWIRIVIIGIVWFFSILIFYF